MLYKMRKISDTNTEDISAILQAKIENNHFSIMVVQYNYFNTYIVKSPLCIEETSLWFRNKGIYTLEFSELQYLPKTLMEVHAYNQFKQNFSFVYLLEVPYPIESKFDNDPTVSQWYYKDGFKNTIKTLALPIGVYAFGPQSMQTLILISDISPRMMPLVLKKMVKTKYESLLSFKILNKHFRVRIK